MDPQLAIEVQVLRQALDTLDYYQILKVQQDATLSEIKRAYYRESRAWHPDRFYHLPDGELKDGVNAIYKRITEAYTVLRDAEKRAKYTADINSPERERKLRFTEASEQEQKQAKAEREGKTPQARQAYRAALREMQAKRWEAAVRQLKTALMYESDNELFQEKLKEAEAELKKMPKKGGGFAIH
ncbi:MAG: molecular chaperone DnaJ [Deltaproteobacteria bacterium]|nr:MAG: molecular chaperone DnaJ [Deltaproteobacteria bacterium]